MVALITTTYFYANRFQLPSLGNTRKHLFVNPSMTLCYCDKNTESKNPEVLLKITKKYHNIRLRIMETNPVWCILGSGGHTAEMCIILQGLLQKTKDINNYKPMKFLVANTDKTSKDKIQLTMDELKQNVGEDDFIYIPRAREVGQSWFTTVFTFLFALVWSFWLVFKEKPRLILCNGPGTCVPFCIAGFLSKLARRSKTKLVYVESFCRVNEISMSGRILLPYLDAMIVQWEPLTKIEYLGRKKIKYFGNIL